ncbi:MAG: PAS domain S-box protein [Thermodesulfobacteriota bacterium]|nr:PAS domain S-box protein [Thermodesulfobacteriota bacterium]
MVDTQSSEIRIIQKINQAIALSPDIRAVAMAILDIVINETHARNVSIMMPSANGKDLEIRAAKGANDQMARYSENPLGQTFPMGKGISGMVAQSLEPVVITDAAHDPVFQSRNKGVKIGSMMSLPLVYAQDELVGVLNMSHPGVDIFSQEDKRLIDILLPPAALALRNARLMRDVQDMNSMLKQELSMTDRMLEGVGRNVLRVFNYMSIGVLTVSLDGEITSINNRAFSFLGTGTGQNLSGVIGKETMDCFAPDMADITRDIEVSGRILEIEVSSLPMKPAYQVLVCVRDVSQERFRQREIVRVKDQYKDMVEKAIDAVYIVKNGRFLLVNKKFQEMLGYSTQELVGRHFRHILPRSSINVLKSIGQFSGDNAFIPNFEIQAVKKGGALVWLEISVGRLLIDGDPCFVGVVRDITSKKEVLAMKTRFLQVTSHEIRVPLTVVRGYASMFSKSKMGTLSDDQRECIEEIQTQSDRLLHFSNSLLDFSRINEEGVKLQRQDMDLCDHLARVVRNMQLKADDRGIKVIFEGEKGLSAVYADPVRVEQAVYNLIDNAIKHSPDRAEVRVELSRGKGGSDINRIFHRGTICISVRDQGDGIRPDEARELFGEFYVGLSGRAKGGFGLGLAITSEIVHAHGGTVEAVPSDQGGHFIITMPLNVPDD